MRGVIVVCLFALGATAGAASEPNWVAWAEAARKHHPLAGSIYLTVPPPPSAPRDWPVIGWSGSVHQDFDAGRRFFRPLPPDGRGPVLPQRILLLGEVHDNPMHHQVRGWLIENSAKAILEWRPAIVFEQIRADQQPALEQFKAVAEGGGGSAAADDLFRLLEWDKTGWPPAQIYKPLFEAVIAGKVPIFAGDPPRGQVRAVARGGLSLVPPEERARLRLDTPMPAMLLDALRQELVRSHCGVLPAEAVEGMATAQRYRDAHLADALLGAAERHRTAILIAGNGHVRSDRGVPWHVRQRLPGAEVMAVLLVEVEEGKTEPAAYVPRDPEGKPAADMLIFTPKHLRPDPCEQMRGGKR